MPEYLPAFDRSTERIVQGWAQSGAVPASLPRKANGARVIPRCDVLLVNQVCINMCRLHVYHREVGPACTRQTLNIYPGYTPAQDRLRVIVGRGRRPWSRPRRIPARPG
jgi:hypothetical protein